METSYSISKTYLRSIKNLLIARHETQATPFAADGDEVM